MKIIDTEVLVASLDPEHRLYNKAIKHLQSITISKEVFVPSITLLECNFVLRHEKLSKEEIISIYEKFVQLIPDEKIIRLTPSLLKKCTELENGISDPFDALVASYAIENEAEVISTDPVFQRIGLTTIW